MTQNTGPLYRPFSVMQMKHHGVDVKIEATDLERVSIAADFGLAEVRSLTAAFRLTGKPDRIKVAGRIKADIQQICVVSLEPFDSIVEETIEVLFVAENRRKPKNDMDESAENEPDPIVNGQIDLGAVACEFMALGLDPYPRKPGISFEDVKKAVGLPEDEGA